MEEMKGKGIEEKVFYSSLDKAILKINYGRPKISRSKEYIVKKI